MRWFSLIHAGSHVSCATLDLSFNPLCISATGLLPCVVWLSNHLLLYIFSLLLEVRTPHVFLLAVWALAISLATTFAIIIIFSSFSYLDVSVHWVPLITLCIRVMIVWHYPYCVSTFGYLRINVYVQLPVDYRSLSRPSSALSAKASTICSL